MVIRHHSISLVDFEIDASIGIHHHEKEHRQRLLISVKLILDPAQRPENDDIATAVDYDFLRVGIRALIYERHYNLQETLVGDILALCGSHRGVARAVVSSRKPDAYSDCSSVGYEAEAEFIPTPHAPA